MAHPSLQGHMANNQQGSEGSVNGDELNAPLLAEPEPCGPSQVGGNQEENQLPPRLSSARAAMLTAGDGVNQAFRREKMNEARRLLFDVLGGVGE